MQYEQVYAITLYRLIVKDIKSGKWYILRRRERLLAYYMIQTI